MYRARRSVLHQCYFPGQSYLIDFDRTRPWLFRLKFRMQMTPTSFNAASAILSLVIQHIVPCCDDLMPRSCHITLSVYFAPQKAASLYD